MVWIIDIVRNLFYNLEQHFDKVVANMGCTRIKVLVQSSEQAAPMMNGGTYPGH